MMLTPEQEEAWWQSHCAACGGEMPVRRRAACYECGHAWRWRWMLSLADMRSRWRVSGCEGPWDFCPPWWIRLTDLRFRRPSKVWVCPCCSHDL